MTTWQIRLSPAAGVTLSLFALALAWDASGLDLPLARLAGSASGFPWRDHWLLSGVLHEGGRALAWLLALALCLSVWWPVGPMARTGLSERLLLAHFMSHTLWSAALCWSVAHAVHAAWPQAWAAEGI